METRIFRELNKTNEDRLLRAEEVAVMIGSSLQTINYWYRFKKAYPDNEYSKMLPDFIQEGERQTRYWHPKDIQKLVDFKNTIPHGRHGILSPITQKYLRNRKEQND